MSHEDLADFDARYEAILDQGFAENPMSPSSKTGPKKRGRPKRSPPRNLLERLRTQKAFPNARIIPSLAGLHRTARNWVRGGTEIRNYGDNVINAATRPTALL